MESPAHLYPARVRLAAKLSEFERAQADLSEYTAKAERAAIEEDRALADEQLTETQAAAEITRAQNERNVYRSRQAQREKAISALTPELKTALGQGNQELQGLVNQEMARRLEIIGVRVLTALEPRDQPGLKPVLSELLDFSLPIDRIRALAPSAIILNTPEHLVQMAKDVLTKFDKVISEAAKKI